MQEQLKSIMEILRANELPVSWKSIIGDPADAEEPGYDDTRWGSGWEGLQGRRWDAAWLRGRIGPAPLTLGDVAAKCIAGGHLTVYVDGKKAGDGYEAEFSLSDNNLREGGALIAVKSAPGMLSYEMVELVRFSSDRLNQIASIRRALLFVTGWREAQPEHAEQIDTVLDRFVAQVDPKKYVQEPMAFWDELVVASTFLKELDGLAKKYTMHVIPHSHVDLAWGWDFPETKRLAKSFFDEALRIMDEDESYTFSQDQPPMYVHLEDSATEGRIRERVQEGRWDIPGATFSEPESFVPGGESWVRHMMYSKRYFKERFGKNICIHWAPDNFSGHANTLPQIWKLCGIKYFAFGNWYQADHGGQFLWEGLDGSRVYAHYFTGHYDSAQMIEQDKVIQNLLSHMRSSERDQYMLMDGDDLTPPWAESPQGLEKLRALPAFPNVEFSTPHRFFDGVDPEPDGLRVLRGELISTYDENERKNNVGAYSTFMPVKFRNRRQEWKLRTMEALATLAYREGAIYAIKHYNRAWRLTLFNQMHDILPGTAIKEAYTSAYKRCDEADSIALIGTNAVVNHLAANIDTRGDGIPVVLFNTLGHERSDVAEVNLTEMQSYNDGFRAVDAEGREVLCQTTFADLGTFDKTNKNYHVLLKPDSVPAMGHTVVWLQPVPADEADRPSMVGPDGHSLDNEKLRVKINPRTGWLSEIYHKETGRNILPPGKEGCELLAWKDLGNPWHLWPEGAPWSLNDTVDVEVVEDGDVRAAIRVTTTSGNSVFAQEFRLSRGSDVLEVCCDVDLGDGDIVVKAMIPLDLPADSPWTCEVPWGAVEREMPVEKLTYPRRGETELRTNDRASQTWMDVSGENWGASVLNNGRYGTSRLFDGTMALTVLRSVPAHKSQEQTDLGLHGFTYAVYPHTGDWREADTVANAHTLNSPMWVTRDIPHEGPKPPRASALSVGPENVVLGALKKAEDDDTWVLHVYETAGRETDAVVEFDAEIDAAWLTDLVEWEKLGDVEIDGKTVRYQLRPFEIIGLRVKLRSE